MIRPLLPLLALSPASPCGATLHPQRLACHFLHKLSSLSSYAFVLSLSGIDSRLPLLEWSLFNLVRWLLFFPIELGPYILSLMDSSCITLITRCYSFCLCCLEAGVMSYLLVYVTGAWCILDIQNCLQSDWMIYGPSVVFIWVFSL